MRIVRIVADQRFPSKFLDISENLIRRRSDQALSHRDFYRPVTKRTTHGRLHDYRSSLTL